MTKTSTIGTQAGSFDFVCEVEAVVGALRRYAKRLTRDDAACDDLVQDTLLRAWAARERFSVGTNFKAWLFRIARNRFLTEMSRSKRQVDLDDDTINRLLTMQPAQEESVHMRDLERALDTLPLDHAAALWAIHDGRTHDVAAQQMGISSSALRSRTFRARKAIGAFFDNPAGATPPARNPSCPSTSNAEGETRSSRGNVYSKWKLSRCRMIG